MTRVRLQITMSLDGFVAGPRQRLEEPLGEGGMALHAWAFATRAFHLRHGNAAEAEAGSTGVDDERLAAAAEGVGAAIMGRNMFGPDRGPWSDAPWEGWWGDEPPFGYPVYVLTHHARPPLVKGETEFRFVTDGIESALAQAVASAGGLDVAIGGGASTARQFLAAGLVDDVEIHVVDVVLGSGERLFEGLDDLPARYAPAGLIAGEGAAHFLLSRREPAQ